MLFRARTALAVLAASLVAAGCGGGGDPSTFGRVADRSCQELKGAVSSLRLDLVRTNARSDGAGMATALDRYVTRVSRARTGLSRANPPSDERRFRDDAVRGLGRHLDAMRDAAQDARRGRTPTALRDKSLGQDLPEIPASVLKDAPRCRAAAR